MFLTNFSTEVKQTVSVKKTKISEYGKYGEVKPSGAKARLYKIFPMKKLKYLTIQSLDLEWSPTAPHLLEESFISIKLKDCRSSSILGKGDLVFLKKPASRKWNLHLELSISTPTSEMMKGAPLSFDINIQSGSVKSGVEIGELKIVAVISSTSDVSGSVIKSATYNSCEDLEESNEFLVWKGMPKPPTNKDNDNLTKLINDYLNGSISMENLGNRIIIK